MSRSGGQARGFWPLRDLPVVFWLLATVGLAAAWPSSSKSSISFSTRYSIRSSDAASASGRNRARAAVQSTPCRVGS